MPAPQQPLHAYKTIGEVAAQLDLPQYLLRFWERRFAEIDPLRRGTGDRARRLYRQDDIDLINGIRYLLHAQGYTIRGVQRILREHGPQHVRDVVIAS
jgi:DNA-binding transcriptional MerR regulator